MTKACRPRRRALLREDTGFTLVEALVAMVILVLLFVGLSTSLGVALRNARETRTQQQATSLSLEGIEFARSLEWNELAMIPTSYAGDSRVVGSSFVGSSIGLSANEPLVESTSGLIPVYTSQTLDGLQFDISQYITTITSGLRRVIVFVEWSNGGVNHAHFTTTEIAEAGAPT